MAADMNYQDIEKRRQELRRHHEDVATQIACAFIYAGAFWIALAIVGICIFLFK